MHTPENELNSHPASFRVKIHLNHLFLQVKEEQNEEWPKHCLSPVSLSSLVFWGEKKSNCSVWYSLSACDILLLNVFALVCKHRINCLVWKARNPSAPVPVCSSVSGTMECPRRALIWNGAGCSPEVCSMVGGTIKCHQWLDWVCALLHCQPDLCYWSYKWDSES